MKRIIAAKLTLEDCLRFKNENPNLTRGDVYQHHCAYLSAMQRLGCFDELFPPTEKGFTNQLTYEDCLKFKEEHPGLSRNDIKVHYIAYRKAMIRLGCYDELYPVKKATNVRHTDVELIAAAKKYSTVRDMKNENPALLLRIYVRGLKNEALSHMKPLGDRKHRMIYAYEFPDNSVYVGLTYDLEKREEGHKSKPNSAVRKHIEATGLTPIRKTLTEFVPVEEARFLEGYYVEKYKSEGWNILNVVATGGIGGKQLVQVKDSIVIELANQGLTAKEIQSKLGIGLRTVQTILSRNKTKARNPHQTGIAFYDKEGNLFKEFSMVSKAADYFGMLDQNLWQNIRRGYKVRGYIPVLLKEPMRAAS